MEIFLFVNFSSMFMFWFWLEVNMILFLVLMCSSSDSSSEVDVFSQSLYYFMIQSTASILLLILFSSDNFFSKNYLIILVSVLKLGIFPFHFWSYKISEYLSVMLLFMMLNIQKIPLLLFTLNYDFTLLFSMVLVNMLGGCFFLFYSSSLTSFLVSSSICFFNWMVFILLWSVGGLVLFLCKYFLFNMSMLSLKKVSSSADYNIFHSFKMILMLTFMMGLPPLFYFFVKLYLITTMVNLGSFSLLFMVWLFSFVCLVSYFNYFINMMFKNNPLYSSFQYLKKSDLMIFIFMITSMITWS